MSPRRTRPSSPRSWPGRACSASPTRMAARGCRCRAGSPMASGSRRRAAARLRGPWAALALADRDRRWLKALRPATGLGLAALVVGPWLVAIETAPGGRFVADAVGHDLLPKLLGAEEAHGAPPG